MRKMQALLVVTLMLFMATMTAAGQSLAGRVTSQGDDTCSTINVLDGIPQTISGIVQSVGVYGQGIRIDADGWDEPVAVYGLGPVRFWDALDVARPTVGDDVVVEAYEVTFSDGTAKLIAFRIEFIQDGDVIEDVLLRDNETGAPLWRGTGEPGGGTGRFG